MILNNQQVDALSKYFSDISKILVASTVIGFFVPTAIGSVPFSVFMVGATVAMGTLVISIYLQK
ncbi:MAG: hypothetical protein Greene071421_135 [Parcubacteria group bacterium Greene0714_21]|nr:MAG: hypothetical protein Greene041639_217 [Parcubacteria group bacterium Greene0416_39]TSC98538.1 MAG: hypothetical protein Greene101447_40 [Parcubacteria group bacterium Greene1014_47]TSD04299.1 MAG: hypothetical protein Greene071421_135 [Parcubacteria group bacterium Greene0714_21]